MPNKEIPEKLKSLESNVEKFESTEQVVEYLQKELESVGITVVDAEIYPSTKSGGVSHDVVIVAGYIPDKASVFTVKFNFSPQGKFFEDFIFEIKGQVEGDEARRRIRGEGEAARDLPRNPVGSESFGYGDFSINHSEFSSGSSVADKIEAGKKFYQNFLEKFGKNLPPRFSKEIHLWFVPEYSDALKELEEKNGQYNDANYEPFNRRVMEKFPKGFFAENQGP